MISFAIFASLLIGASRTGVAACQSTCTRQLVACKQACPATGKGRRDCRAACADRSACTAPGAAIRTLAYVVTECTTDPQGRSALGQKLLVRRGNCDPVPVLELPPPPPVPDPVGICRALSVSNFLYMQSTSGVAGVFQHVGVLPDGSGVIFDLKKPTWPNPPIAPELPEEGVFIARAGTRRRVGEAGLPTWFWVGQDAAGPPCLAEPCGINLPVPTTVTLPVSPNGRSIALVDLGPDRSGNLSRQVFLLDLRSGKRTQLTHMSYPTGPANPGIWFLGFLDNRTVGFSSGPTNTAAFKAFRVRTDGRSDETEIPPVVFGEGGHIVSQFGLTGSHPRVATLNLGTSILGPLPRELVLLDGKRLLQLTRFSRLDTGPSSCCSFVARGRAFFRASADPLRENPAELCQLFSITTLGGDLRQITHLRSRVPSSTSDNNCFGNACGVSYAGIAADPVTGTVVFSADCDPTGGNPSGLQIFAMRPDGTGLRQLTATRGTTYDPDGTLRVEIPGPYGYQTPVQGGGG